MTANSSHLGNETSEVNSQMEGPTDMPFQSAKDLQELVASGSSPLPTCHFGPWPGGYHPVALI